MNAFMTLLHAHDKLWCDRTWPLAVRQQACQLLWDKALELLAGTPQKPMVQP
jgi:hypothetical protein